MPRQVLDDDVSIRAYVHPTRMVILALLGPQSRTATGIARELGVHPANLTRHLKLLERTGLIQLVERRDTGRNVEKYYQASARAYDVRLKTDRIEDRRATVLGILRDNLATAVATARDDDSCLEVVGMLQQSRIRRDDVGRLQERLTAVLQEFGDLNDPDGSPYNLSLALYPAEAAAPGAEWPQVEI